MRRLERLTSLGFVVAEGLAQTDITGIVNIPLIRPNGLVTRSVITCRSVSSSVTVGSCQLRVKAQFDEDNNQLWTFGLQALDSFSAINSAGPVSLPTGATNGQSYKVVMPPTNGANQAGEILAAFLSFTVQGATTGDQTWNFFVSLYGD